MRIVQGMRAVWLAALLALAGCGGGFVLYFGDGDWPVSLTVVAPTRIETGQPVDLRPGGLSSYGGLRFEWNFGDGGSFRFEAQPSHTYDRAGSYTIVLHVSDDDETLSASLRVDVGAWSNVDGRPCTGPAFSGWCQQPAAGSGADIDGLWFFDSRQGLARETGGGLWRTGDGGRNWIRVGPTVKARFAADGTGWDLRAQALWRSTDLGRSWQALPMPAGAATDAQFVDAKQGWLRVSDCSLMACVPRLYRTQDGGQRWQAVDLPAAEATLHFIDGLRGVASDGRAAAWATEDGGQTWTAAAVAFGSAGSTVQRIAFDGTQRGWMLLALASGTMQLLRTADGGRSWTAPQPLPGSRLSDLAFGDALAGWAVGEGGQLWATRDGGLSWQAQASGTSRNLRVVAAHDGQTAWAAGAQGTLLATATGGR